VRRGHANIDDRNVGRLGLDGSQELFAGRDLCDDVEALVRQEA
jgi:hypothetical protein